MQGGRQEPCCHHLAASGVGGHAPTVDPPAAALLLVPPLLIGVWVFLITFVAALFGLTGQPFLASAKTFFFQRIINDITGLTTSARSVQCFWHRACSFKLKAMQPQ